MAHESSPHRARPLIALLAAAAALTFATPATQASASPGRGHGGPQPSTPAAEKLARLGSSMGLGSRATPKPSHRAAAARGKAGSATADACGTDTRFDPRMFKDSTDIDNRWFSLRPGTRVVFDGFVDDGDGPVPHRVVFTVTNLTKVINGVNTRVIWDDDFSDGQLVESELAFFAQDKHGNVWTMGEYPEEFEDGEFVGAPSTWISGQADAEAGILVPGHPRVGASFMQGFAPEVEFLDCATVADTHATTCIDGTCFRRVLVVDESSPLDPASGHQLKYYARGTGLIKIAPLGGNAVEILERTSTTTLSENELQEANGAALRLERRAYEVSEVYQTTAPARACQSAQA